jgi:predicted sugar kinase
VMGTCLAANSFEPTGMEVPAGRVSNTMESERQFWRLSQSWGSQLYCVAGGRAKSAYNQCSKDRMVANGAVAQIIVPKKRSKWRRLVRDWWRRSRIMSRSFLCLSG